HRGRWSVYEGLRDELIARGMPAAAIRFAQEAKTRRQKDELDQDARDGKIAVLIGSRQGLGTGRNIQRRVISVVQLDPTWKPSPPAAPSYSNCTAPRKPSAPSSWNDASGATNSSPSPPPSNRTAAASRASSAASPTWTACWPDAATSTATRSAPPSTGTPSTT